MKAENNQSCGLPFTDTRKNSPRLFQSKKIPAEHAWFQINAAGLRSSCGTVRAGHSFEQESQATSKIDPALRDFGEVRRYVPITGLK